MRRHACMNGASRTATGMHPLAAQPREPWPSAESRCMSAACGHLQQAGGQHCAVTGRALPACARGFAFRPSPGAPDPADERERRVRLRRMGHRSAAGTQLAPALAAFPSGQCGGSILRHVEQRDPDLAVERQRRVRAGHVAHERGHQRRVERHVRAQRLLARRAVGAAPRLAARRARRARLLRQLVRRLHQARRHARAAAAHTERSARLASTPALAFGASGVPKRSTPWLPQHI
jgi:hypothetical protein